MGLGAYMFVTHRLTAVGLTIYLYVHLITLGSVLKGPQSFDRAMALMNRPSVRLLELLLVGAVLFHTLNGLRLCILAVAPRVNQRWLAYTVLAISLLVLAASLPLFLS